jgi:GntR family transcriptional regulator
MTTGVSRDNPLPLYVQLEQALLQSIGSQGLRPGDRLPTEAEIEETYSVSRQTIRQALSRLVADGHVERVQGLGSFVAKRRPTHQSLLTSFTENMHAQGYTPERRLLRSETVATPSQLRDEPGFTSDTCQFVLRLLLADLRPIGVSETWLPVDALAGRVDLFTAEVLESGSLYELLQGPDIGLALHSGRETVRADLATPAQAQMLECGVNDPTLVVRRSSLTRSGRPVEWTVMTFAADRYEYSVELVRPADDTSQARSMG